MNETKTGKMRTRRAVLRRRRRERQILIFGVLLIAVGAITTIAYSVYLGNETGPYTDEFVTREGGFASDITLACPPDGAVPLTTDEVVVRVLNGTDIQGLASQTRDDLVGRGFVNGGATNWNRPYGDGVRIMFGVDGVHDAYTLANHFTEVKMVLDARDGKTVDVVLGTLYEGLRELDDPILDPERPLEATASCLPASRIYQESAPSTLPFDPTEVQPSEEPSGEPTDGTADDVAVEPEGELQD